MKTTCFLWNEPEGRKGSYEAATCLLQFLSRAHSNNVKKVHFLCDRYCGQNSYRMVYLMLAVALEMYRFEEITFKFLVSGHSQNENDTTHSIIERAASKMAVNSTAQWETLKISAFKKKKPVIECLSHSDVIDFRSNYFPKFSKMIGSNVYDIDG